VTAGKTSPFRKAGECMFKMKKTSHKEKSSLCKNSLEENT
jgi:hypothetical protein